MESTDESAAKAESLGATIVQAPMDVPGVGRMAFFTDPTGANIAVFQPGDHPGADPDKTNLGWAELHTPNPEASKAFYTALFHWSSKEDPSGQYTEWLLDGYSIGGMMVIPSEPQDMSPQWMIYASVGDCDETLAKAADMGGTTIVPAQDVPNVGRFGVIADPTGAVIAVIKLIEHG